MGRVHKEEPAAMRKGTIKKSQKNLTNQRLGHLFTVRTRHGQNFKTKEGKKHSHGQTAPP